MTVISGYLLLQRTTDGRHVFTAAAAGQQILRLVGSKLKKQ